MEKDINKIAETLVNLTVKEVNELAKVLKEEYGIEPVVSVAPQQIQEAAPIEEKTSFDVFLKEVGGKKLNVIKEVRNLLQLGLRECKELVDSAPIDVAKDVSRMRAEEIKAKLETAGATVELK